MRLDEGMAAPAPENGYATVVHSLAADDLALARLRPRIRRSDYSLRKWRAAAARDKPTRFPGVPGAAFRRCAWVRFPTISSGNNPFRVNLQDRRRPVPAEDGDGASALERAPGKTGEENRHNYWPASAPMRQPKMRGPSTPVAPVQLLRRHTLRGRRSRLNSPLHTE